MRKVDYDERQHAVYAAGRQMLPDALHTWMEAFARHVPETRPMSWLDLGSGIGRMTPSLATTFGGPVYGVEPSDKMRAQAIAHAGHPAVTYEAGSAEYIPLPDSSCDAALLFSSGTTSSIGMVRLGSYGGWLGMAARSLCRRTSPIGRLIHGGYRSYLNGWTSTSRCTSLRKL